MRPECKSSKLCLRAVALKRIRNEKMVAGLAS